MCDAGDFSDDIYKHFQKEVKYLLDTEYLPAIEAKKGDSRAFLEAYIE